MENENQESVTITADEEVVLEEETTNDGDNVEELKQKLAEREEAMRQLTARAKAAEAKLKAEKPVEAQPITNSSLSAEDVDIKILQSQGKDEETIKFLKKLATVNGTSVLAAQTDDLFVSWNANREAKEKAEKASLGATRGSGQAQRTKSTTTPNLSEEEHRALWRKQNGL